MEKLTDWLTDRFEHPLSFFLFLLGGILILLGLTTGFQIPVLQQLSIDPAYRILSIIIGSVSILFSIFFTTTQENSSGFLRIGRQTNQLKSKDKIDRMWQHLLSGATQSVFIFAGDVSWIDRDKEVLNSNTKTQGNKVRILCRRPRKNQLLKDNVAKLIKTGAEVKYYDESQPPVVRGILIDSSSADVGAALTVAKSAKFAVKREYGVPGTEDTHTYDARLYIPPKDIRQVQILDQLFNVIWEHSITGVVLEPKIFSEHEMLSLLSKIPQYNGIQVSDFEIRSIDIASLWTTCTYVKEYKFADTLALLDAYDTQDIQMFAPCLCISHFQNSFLLPPIVEQQDDKLVIVDGMHRLFCRLAFMHKADAICLVVSVKKDLPSAPIPFTDVKIWPRKMPRENSFINFDPSRFRDIEVLERALSDLYSQESKKY
ncbi:MAG: hypothetical protein HS114_01450 [Anaerolineales bacterium]|nr:hypothetical protein [Anaerolineales bacterium]